MLDGWIGESAGMPLLDRDVAHEKPVATFDQTGIAAGYHRLPAKELHQVMEKITLLTEDPRPDNKTKKQLMHYPGRPFRVRSGDYRIFYTYNQRYVNIYRIERRNETIYKARPED